MRFQYNLIVFSSLMLLFSASALNAAVLSISDIDLTLQTFTVDTLNNNPDVTGTSNGIDYSLTADTAFFSGFSNTTELQQYNDLPNSYDDLHLGVDFTIQFAQPIDYLLVALANDNNTGDGLNFGLTPDDSTGISVLGTQLSITDIGGALALFVFDSPVISLTHTDNNGMTDGFDVSFFAGVTPIPVPPAVWLFGSALLGLVGYSRKRVSS